MQKLMQKPEKDVNVVCYCIFSSVFMSYTLFFNIRNMPKNVIKYFLMGLMVATAVSTLSTFQVLDLIIKFYRAEERHSLYVIPKTGYTLMPFIALFIGEKKVRNILITRTFSVSSLFSVSAFSLGNVSYSFSGI